MFWSVPGTWRIMYTLVPPWATTSPGKVMEPSALFRTLATEFHWLSSSWNVNCPAARSAPINSTSSGMDRLAGRR